MLDDTDLAQSPDRLAKEEGEWLGDNTGPTPTESNQTLSVEQSYRETITGIRSFMGWTDIPDFESSSPSAADNPW